MNAVKPIVDAMAPRAVAHFAQQNSKQPVQRKEYANSAAKRSKVGVVKGYTPV